MHSIRGRKEKGKGQGVEKREQTQALTTPQFENIEFENETITRETTRLKVGGANKIIFSEMYKFYRDYTS